MDYGVRPNQSQQSWQSLGAVATGVVHIQTRYRTGADGASLHPFQRDGSVSAESHLHSPNHATFSPVGLGGGPPASVHNMALPPIVKVGMPGTSLDPMMRV